MQRRVHLRISGLVQGVCFRAETRAAARSLGLAGWVRNLRDGRVEAMAEGEESDLHRFVEWCRRGPPAAEVEAVEEDWSEGKGETSGFQITY